MHWAGHHSRAPVHTTVLNRRYSHQRAARIAAPFIVVVGVIGGLLAARTIPGSPPILVNVVIWGLIGAFTGYLVFASEGPQQRPTSVVQAAMADGVVAGILTALSGTLVDVISASGAGSSSSGSLSLGGAILTLVLAIVLGALVGAAAGELALAVGGRERFERLPAGRPKSNRNSALPNQRRPAQKTTRKRSKR
jgi:hypothetical protein